MDNLVLVKFNLFTFHYMFNFQPKEKWSFLEEKEIVMVLSRKCLLKHWIPLRFLELNWKYGGKRSF